MTTLDQFDPKTIIRNKHYESDLKYDLELNRTLLKIIGVWPVDSRHTTNFDRFLRVLAKFLTTFFVLFLMIPIGCYIFFVEQMWSARIQLLVTVTYCFETIIKYAIVIALNERMKCCIDMIDKDWREVGEKTVNRSIMLNTARSCRVFTILFVTLSYSGVLIYDFILPFVSNKSQQLGQNGTNLAPILYGTEFFIVDARVSPMSEIVYLGQSLGAAATVAINCGICTIIVKFAMHACSRYQMVVVSMQSIDDAENNGSDDFKRAFGKQRNFGKVIRRHLYATE